jgi:ribosomal-protein-alanine N-acetyltransferase
MTEAVARILKYSFEHIGLHRIEGLPLVENRAGIRVLEKVGTQREGLLREHLFQKGAFRDFAGYAMLRGEGQERHGGE